MPAEILVTRDILAEDTVFILQYLRESAREGRSMHMMDARQFLANSLTLEFSDYLRFLRKHDYVALDREQHTLSLGPAGDRLAQAGAAPALVQQLEQFFADKLKAGVIEVQTEEEERTALGSLVESRPPPPPDDLTPMPGPMPAPPAHRSRDQHVLAGAFSGMVASGPALAHSGVDELIYLRGEVIGQGPLGAVFVGRHASLGTEIAVKEIREPVTRRIFASPADLALRLKQELGRQAQLRHPAIVAIHDLDVTVPQPFAVLEFCGGGNLRARLKARGGKGLEPTFVLRAFGQLLSGLAAAHDRGLTHHNLKAENILFDQYGNAKLGDFGLSRLLSVDLGTEGRAVVDASNMSYLAPEVIQPAGAPPGPAADVYALGILLYEALTGRVPGRRSPLPSKAAVGVPAEVDELFDKLTADRLEDRYQHAGDALDDFLASFPDGRYGEPGRVFFSVTMPDPDETTDGGDRAPIRKGA